MTGVGGLTPVFAICPLPFIVACPLPVYEDAADDSADIDIDRDDIEGCCECPDSVGRYPGRVPRGESCAPEWDAPLEAGNDATLDCGEDVTADAMIERDCALLIDDWENCRGRDVERGAGQGSMGDGDSVRGMLRAGEKQRSEVMELRLA